MPKTKDTWRIVPTYPEERPGWVNKVFKSSNLCWGFNPTRLLVITNGIAITIAKKGDWLVRKPKKEIAILHT